MIIEVEAQSIGIIYKKFNSGKMGRALIKIDGEYETLLEGHYPCNWGGYSHGQIIAGNLQKGLHKVEITFLNDHHKDSCGTEFEICGFLIAKT